MMEIAFLIGLCLAIATTLTSTGILLWLLVSGRIVKRDLKSKVEFIRRVPAVPSQPMRVLRVKGHARVSEAHMSQPRSDWSAE